MENFTQFEIFNKTFDEISNLKTSPAEKLVYMYLVRCTNPNNKNIVFPATQTIANNLGLSIRTVVRSVETLVHMGFITKSKFNGKNQNAYFIKMIDDFTAEKVVRDEEGLKTKNVLGQIVTSKNDKLSHSKVTNCHFLYKNKKRNKKMNKHQQLINEKNPIRDDDDLLRYPFVVGYVPVFLKDVPEHIKNNKKIKNPCAYWASLSREAKASQLEYAKELERKQLAQEELKRKKEEEARRLAEEKRKEEELRNIPFEKQYSRDAAIRHIRQFEFLGKERMRNSYRINALLKEHNLNLDEVMGWTSE